MEIVDKRGRLFGLINVFDLIILFMLGLSAFFVYKWVHMAEDPSWVNVKLYHTHCIAESGFPAYMIDLVKEGDEMVNEDGVVVVRIEKVLSNEPASVATYFSKDGEKLFFSSETRNVTMLLKLQSYEKKGEVYACVSGIPIKVGASFQVTTKKYSNPFIIRKILSTGE